MRLMLRANAFRLGALKRLMVNVNAIDTVTRRSLNEAR